MKKILLAMMSLVQPLHWLQVDNCDRWNLTLDGLVTNVTAGGS